MKKLNWFLALTLSFGLCFFMAPKKSNVNNQTSAHVADGVLNWDAERKLIYANQNNLLITSEGTGTTIYLDAGTVGELDANDLSLADYHAAHSDDNESNPPADGSDLSLWSIVFGAEDYTGGAASSVPTTITMTGGKIKNIYAGHSALSHETNNFLKGSVTFTLTGGEIEKIYTDGGYEEIGVAGKAYGTDVTFNLFGGTVDAVERIKTNAQDAFNSKINLKDDIKIVDGITFVNANSGKGINVVGAFSNTARVAINLNSNFEKSDMIMEITESALSLFDASVFELKNIPDDSDYWAIYVSENKYIRFGNNQKITAVGLVGQLQVGKVLQIETTPADASVSNVVWFRKNSHLGNASIIGTGLSYTLKNEDGGKLVYAEVFDKNDSAAKWTVETLTVVQRTELPEIVTANGKTTVYANGNDLLVVQSGAGSTIYLDAGTIGELDELDVSLKDASIANAFENGSDLSNVTISAGSSNDENAGDFAITVLSGKIKEITAHSTNGEKLTEGVVVNLFGGEIGSVSVSKADVKLYAIINLAGNVKAKIAGVQNENGATQINVVSPITSDARSIKIVLSKNLIDENNVISSAIGVDLTKFDFVDGKGKILSTFKVVTNSTGVNLDPIDATSAKLDGTLKNGKIISANINPDNANVTYTWFRNSKKSLEGASLIEGENSSKYTLTKEDVGKFVILVLNYETENEIVAITETEIKNKISAFAIVMIVLASVIVLLISGVAVWFVLWKKKICGASFMTKPFEKIDNAIFKNKENKK